ncbi:MAG: VOC family protein [Gemmatimonadales bacterium]|nr:VOC family protein [Gemmatimonadales bacterium]
MTQFRDLAHATALLLCLAPGAPAQSPSTRPASPLAGATGAFIALSVADLEASARWYTETLGLRRVMTIPRMGPIVGGAAFEGDGIFVELIQRDDATPGPTPAELSHGIVKAGILVADFDRTVAALRARGVTFFAGPFPARPGQRANVMFKDNAGNMLQVLGPLTN